MAAPHTLIHTPPFRAGYEDAFQGDDFADCYKRPRVYMSPEVWMDGHHPHQAGESAAAAGAMMEVEGGLTLMSDQEANSFFVFSPEDGSENGSKKGGSSEKITCCLGGGNDHSSQGGAATGRTDMSVYKPIMMTGNTPNSTSSIFCRNTVCNPDADQIILCMSSVLQVQMLHDQDADDNLRQQFNYFELSIEEGAAQKEAGLQVGQQQQMMMMEMEGRRTINGEDGAMNTGMEIQQEQNAILLPPQGGQVSQEEEEVTVEQIHEYIEGIFRKARFSPECNIIALVYINRVISLSSIPLHRKNWKAIVLVALLLAQKVWDDRCVPLSMFINHVPGYTIEKIRMFERKFLELLQYKATVTQALYTRYYFELRALFEKLLEQENISREFPLRPLALWQARRLELTSDSFGLRPRGLSHFRSNLKVPPSAGDSGSVSTSSHHHHHQHHSSGGGAHHHHHHHPHHSRHNKIVAPASAPLGGALPTSSRKSHHQQHHSLYPQHQQQPQQGASQVPGGFNPTSPSVPFSPSSATITTISGGGGASAASSSSSSSTTRHHQQQHPSCTISSVASSTSSRPSSRAPLRSMLPIWGSSPSSPSPTYEDVTYRPKGRYVQS